MGIIIKKLICLVYSSGNKHLQTMEHYYRSNNTGQISKSGKIESEATILATKICHHNIREYLDGTLVVTNTVFQEIVLSSNVDTYSCMNFPS